MLTSPVPNFRPDLLPSVGYVIISAFTCYFILSLLLCRIIWCFGTKISKLFLYLMLLFICTTYISDTRFEDKEPKGWR